MWSRVPLTTTRAFPMSQPRNLRHASSVVVTCALKRCRTIEYDSSIRECSAMVPTATTDGYHKHRQSPAHVYLVTISGMTRLGQRSFMRARNGIVCFFSASSSRSVSGDTGLRGA